MTKLKKVYMDWKPDIVVVQGDTTTSTAAAIAAFYLKIDVAHVEAGLRTGDIYAPFPEEFNRKVTGNIAKYHFAPTESSKRNLMAENVTVESIIVTGNTVIDALLYSVNKIKNDELTYDFDGNLDLTKKIILVTAHRRESFGEGFVEICLALREIARQNSDCEIIYPVHLNPNVQKPVNEHLRDVDNIKLIDPVNYEEIVYLMMNSHLILTDSGGIQEEAPSLGIPVLVLREKTERPEAVVSGNVKLVGTDKENIVRETQRLLNDKSEYDRMSEAVSPYGDGLASTRIRKCLSN
jgi:UDP-N-acetylglucosamine 2-epimerase (non-hydrolysing)